MVDSSEDSINKDAAFLPKIAKRRPSKLLKTFHVSPPRLDIKARSLNRYVWTLNQSLCCSWSWFKKTQGVQCCKRRNRKETWKAAERQKEKSWSHLNFFDHLLRRWQWLSSVQVISLVFVSYDNGWPYFTNAAVSATNSRCFSFFIVLSLPFWMSELFIIWLSFVLLLSRFSSQPKRILKYEPQVRFSVFTIICLWTAQEDAYEKTS